MLLGFLFLFSSVGVNIATTAKAETCKGPDQATTASVSEYVAAKYHVDMLSGITLRDSSRANDDCYWKMKYEVLATHKNITLFLTPDGKYLAPSLMDRRADPLAEEKTERAAIEEALTIGRVASRGPADATVTVVEFSDFECPYCQRLTTALEKEVLDSDAKVRLVFRNFPLPMHPWAQNAAQDAACVKMQNDDAFWRMHDYIFSNRRSLTVENINEKLMDFVANDKTLDKIKYQSCVDDGITMGQVAKDTELGKRLGVHATPTFFVNGSRIDGYRDSASLKQIIAKARAGELPPYSLSAPQVASAQTGSSNSAACTPSR